MKQPPAFYAIFMLEVWERFGFYTVQGILTLYFIRAWGFDDTKAYYTMGAFSALVYGMTVFGGYIGDQVLGTKRTIVLGLCIMALGYLGLAVFDKNYIFFALGLVCVGSGLFKPNPSNLLSKCYSANDQRLHGAFTLYYMAVNLGSIAALFAGPMLSTRFGYPYAYFASFIGIVLGLANYWFQRVSLNSIHTFSDKRFISYLHWIIIILSIFVAALISAYLLQHVMIAQSLVWIVALVVFALYFLYMRKKSKSIILRMLVAFILIVEAIVFFTLYQQMPTSMNLFAVNNVVPTILGMNIDPQSFQSLNPIWIIFLSPLLAFAYTKFNKLGIDFPIPYKFALGMTFCGLGFIILFFARYVHNDVGMVSSWWLVASYFFGGVGELLVSALGVAMVAELVPTQITGFVMGMWFLAPAIAGFSGAFVASFTAFPKDIQPGIDTLMIYTSVFAYIGVVTLIVALLLWIISPYLIKLIRVC